MTNTLPWVVLAVFWGILQMRVPEVREMDTADRRGRFRDFERGSIYWKSQTGAHEVHGDIRIKWAQLGESVAFRLSCD
jgi:hypothetical protein